MKPRLLDLFSGAGGSAVGYARAGFEVVGVDVRPQPNYPFEFWQKDALTVLRDFSRWRHTRNIARFDAIHASPPCQDHSSLSTMANYTPHGTGDLLPQTIDLLKQTGLPWVVENVVGPTVKMDGWWFVLCGSMFPETERIRRHRRFGASFLVMPPTCRHGACPPPIEVTGHGGPSPRSRKARNREEAQEVMGIDWMTHTELVQAIPPAYTEWIGNRLREQLPAFALAATNSEEEGGE